MSKMKELKTIELKIDNAIATITFNRPNAANGLNLMMAQELYQVVLDLDHDESVKVVVLLAEGRFFSAGGDIKYMSSNLSNLGPTMKQLADELHRSISILARMPKPFIIGVNGIAAGGGFSISMTADLVIAAQSSKFTMAYTASGLSPDGSSTYFVPRIIGLRRTAELMMTNRQLTAMEALDWGLVNQVVPDVDLKNSVYSLAEKLANGPVDAFATVKKLLQCSFTNSLETQMELEGRAIAESASSRNGIEGISAFLEKRKPIFK